MTWALVLGDSTMDVIGVEVVDGKKTKIEVRNIHLVYANLIGQLLFMLFFYTELYLIRKLKRPKAVRGFLLKTFGLMLLTLLLYSPVIIYLIIPNINDNSKKDGIAGMILFYTTVAICYGFIRMWVKHENDKKQLEFVKNQAELNLLRQQLQPHFLFNTMNNLLSMVNQSDNPKLAESIDKLSGLLRYVVYDTKKDRVFIAEEIEFIRNFAQLHLLRFEDDEVDFQFTIEGANDKQKIEPGIFLCYVENAFKHGVQPEEKSMVHLHLDLSKKNEIVFIIENSIPKQVIAKASGGFGLASNKERLHIAYPHKHRIIIKKNENQYRVELKINTDESDHS